MRLPPGLQHRRRRLDDELEAMHEAWATDPKRCDFYGERTFAQLQWMLQFQVDQDGDIFGSASTTAPCS
jgi:capsid protein